MKTSFIYAQLPTCKYLHPLASFCCCSKGRIILSKAFLRVSALSSTRLGMGMWVSMGVNGGGFLTWQPASHNDGVWQAWPSWLPFCPASGTVTATPNKSPFGEGPGLTQQGTLCRSAFPMASVSWRCPRGWEREPRVLRAFKEVASGGVVWAVMMV